MEIHGGTTDSSAPAEVGLIDTALKKSSQKTLREAFSNSSKVKRVVAKLHAREVVKYERSEDNMIRSISVYYSGGIVGKKKYRKIYRDSAFTTKRGSVSKRQTRRITINHLPVAKLIPYNKLMPFVKSIPIGKVYSVYDTLCDGLKNEERVHGCYRDLTETLITLATFYFSRKRELIWFGEPYTFYFTVGGDAAPFGKDDSACAWLISFMNIGRAVLSSNENFLLFGANCSEICTPVKRYIRILFNDISLIENKIFSLNLDGKTVRVKFCLGELPNDMKMVAFLSGELSNSAKFFSSFADVTEDNGKNITGTFGKEENSTWKPWKYQHRLKVVKGVEKLKSDLKKSKLSEATKRNKVTTFISNSKSRQEFQPLVGELVDKIHVEPLHLKNNACALAHRCLLNEVLTISNYPPSVNSFSKVPAQSPLGKYVHALRTQCHLTRLAKRVIKWFDETKGEGKAFDYRFTGKESRGFLHDFMYLIAAVEPFAIRGSKSELNLHVLSYLCLTLRDCVSLFCRLKISDQQVIELKQLCTRYFKIHFLHFGFHQTAWTLGNVVPVHTKELKDKYDMGLGLNSMEGREAKHISIARYSKNTNYQSRWDQIFRHEFISLIWLRERGHNIDVPSTTSDQYIPKRVEKDEYCYCGYAKEDLTVSSCKFCSSPFRGALVSKVG